MGACAGQESYTGKNTVMNTIHVESLLSLSLAQFGLASMVMNRDLLTKNWCLLLRAGSLLHMGSLTDIDGPRIKTNQLVKILVSV